MMPSFQKNGKPQNSSHTISQLLIAKSASEWVKHRLLLTVK